MSTLSFKEMTFVNTLGWSLKTDNDFKVAAPACPYTEK